MSKPRSWATESRSASLSAHTSLGSDDPGALDSVTPTDEAVDGPELAVDGPEPAVVASDAEVAAASVPRAHFGPGGRAGYRRRRGGAGPAPAGASVAGAGSFRGGRAGRGHDDRDRGGGGRRRGGGRLGDGGVGAGGVVVVATRGEHPAGQGGDADQRDDCTMAEDAHATIMTPGDDGQPSRRWVGKFARWGTSPSLPSSHSPTDHDHPPRSRRR